ncbi:MAG: VWA domain-containing protein [Chloroflexota bacterium]
MDMLWPTSLYLLILIPFLVAVYIWTLRRRKRYTVRYSSLTLIRDAMPRSSSWRRHLPFVLFLLALAALMMAFSRPVTKVTVPMRRATILMAIDISRSMCATDIAPNRLEAAKAAALSFVEQQESTTEIGLVAFAGFAELIQTPTTDRQLMREAILGLTTARRTAIGSGILESLDALAEVDDNIAPSGELELPGAEAPLAEGEFVPAIIVLLTDGVSNSGPYPLEAAVQAKTRGVRVYTIGFGTEDLGSLRDCSSPFGFEQQFFGGGGGGFRRGIDEPTLREIARLTGGKYYAASSADELKNVFEDLPTYMIMREEVTEVSAFFTAAGTIFALLAIALSMLWHPVS